MKGLIDMAQIWMAFAIVMAAGTSFAVALLAARFALRGLLDAMRASTRS